MMMMQSQPQTQTPMSGGGGGEKLRPRSGRTPLQPKNSPNTMNPIIGIQIPSPIKPNNPVMGDDDDDKENRLLLPLPKQILIEREVEVEEGGTGSSSSLGDELFAIKKKMERMRKDKERTEKTLKERERMMDEKMKELEERGEVQKVMEIQVDRLFRLKELKSRCMRVSLSPIRTLREKQQLNLLNQSPSPSKVKIEDPAVTSQSESESREGCEIQSPGSACSKTDTHSSVLKSDC